MYQWLVVKLCKAISKRYLLRPYQLLDGIFSNHLLVRCGDYRDRCYEKELNWSRRSLTPLAALCPRQAA